MKICKYFLLLSMVVLGGMTVSSCGDDDDDEGGASGGSGSTSAVTIGNTGTRLTQVGNYTLTYDNQGRLSEITEGYDKCQFTYNPNKIIMIDGGSSGVHDTQEMSASYNSKGYLSAFTSNYSFKEDGASITVNGKANLTYDGNGHLTKVTTTGSQTGSYEGQKFSETANTTVTLTWQSGKLVKIVYENVENSADGKETTSETYTFDYGNNQYPNTTKQYSYNLAYIISDEFLGVGGMVGLFGVGPDYLPVSVTSITHDFYDGEDHEYTYNYSYTYQFNDNGTIAYESKGYGYGSGYNYVYDSAK